MVIDNLLEISWHELLIALIKLLLCISVVTCLFSSFVAAWSLAHTLGIQKVVGGLSAVSELSLKIWVLNRLVFLV